MRISVALATHNSERHLAALLDSLMAQTVLPHELVAIDDASGDATPRLLREFAEAAPFPVHVHVAPANRGHAATFLDAASRCEGDAIAFADHDDVWLRGKVEACARALDRSGALVTLHDMRVVDAELRDLGRTWPGIGSDALVPPLHANALEFHAPGACMVFRRELLDVADPAARPPSRYLEGHPMEHDEWVFFLAGVCGPLALLAEPLVLWRRHEANVSGSVPESRAVRLAPVIENYRRAAALNEAYGRFLEAAAGRAPLHSARLREGAESYLHAARDWRLRVALYEAAERRRRMGFLLRLVRSGAYRARRLGGLGLAALPKDLIAGFLLRQRVV